MGDKTDIPTTRALNAKVKELPKGPFSKVRAARELIKEQALDTYKAYRALADECVVVGRLEIAEKILWNLIEHMPHEDHERMIDPSASKPAISGTHTGPMIQIGLQLGGMSQTKQLVAETIDADPEPDK